MIILAKKCWNRAGRAKSMPRQIADVTLLRLSVPHFIALLDQIPILAQRLQFILDSYRLMLNTHFAWREHG